ncbi:MAG: hypothetical protein AABX08_04000 [Nanoarchaeota archaeon]
MENKRELRNFEVSRSEAVDEAKLEFFCLGKKDVTDAIEEGENFIKIFPREEFEIVQLEILLKED